MAPMSKRKMIVIVIILILVLSLFGTMMYIFTKHVNSISGYVYDSKTKDPIRNAVVRLYDADKEPPDEAFVTKTDGDGFFIFHFMDTNANFLMSAAETFHYIQYQYYDASEIPKFYLNPGGLLEGKVDIGPSANISSFCICLATNETKLVSSFSDDISASVLAISENGTFSSPLLHEGNYRISIDSDRYRPTPWVNVTVTYLKTTTVNLSAPDHPAEIWIDLSLNCLDNDTYENYVKGKHLPLLLLRNWTVVGGAISDINSNMMLGLSDEGNYTYLIRYTTMANTFYAYGTIEVRVRENGYFESTILIKVSIID